MRRVLRKIALNEIHQLGDTSTLADPDILDEIIRAYAHATCKMTCSTFVVE